MSLLVVSLSSPPRSGRHESLAIPKRLKRSKDGISIGPSAAAKHMYTVSNALFLTPRGVKTGMTHTVTHIAVYMQHANAEFQFWFLDRALEASYCQRKRSCFVERSSTKSSRGNIRMICCLRISHDRPTQVSPLPPRLERIDKPPSRLGQARLACSRRACCRFASPQSSPRAPGLLVPPQCKTPRYRRRCEK